MKILSFITSKISVFFWGVMAFTYQVKADIPQTDDFADGADDQGGIDTLYWLLEKFMQFIVLGVAAIFIIVIAKAAIVKYNEISDGRGGWLDLAGHVVGGVALLTLAIVMFNWIPDWIS